MIGVYNQFNHSHYLPQEFVIDTAPLCSIKENQVRSERTGDQDARIYNAYNQTKDRITQQTNLVDKIAKVLVHDQSEDDPEHSPEVQMRYFNADTLDVLSKGVCRRCKKPGHYEKWCTEEQAETKAVCRFCLGDHYYLKCPNNLCYKCNQFGHMAKDCIEDGVKCHRCNKRGHKSKDCNVIDVGDNVFEKDKQRLKDLICITCRTRGHLNCYSLEFQKFDSLYQDPNKQNKQIKNSSKDQKKDNYYKLHNQRDNQRDNSSNQRDYQRDNQRDYQRDNQKDYQRDYQRDNQKDYQRDNQRDNQRGNSRDYQRDNQRGYQRDNYNQKDYQRDNLNNQNHKRDNHNQKRNPPNVPLKAIKSIQKNYSPISRSPLSMWSEESPGTKRMNNNRKQKKRKQKKNNKFN